MPPTDDTDDEFPFETDSDDVEDFDLEGGYEEEDDEDLI